MADTPAAVLFACSENSIRSPLAEALLKHLMGHRIYVDSCGVRAQEIDPFVVPALDEPGIDRRNHQPKTFEELDDSASDLTIWLAPQPQHSAVTWPRTMACDVDFWNTFDPSLAEGARDAKMAAYRDVRDQLLDRIKRRFPAELKPQV